MHILFTMLEEDINILRSIIWSWSSLLVKVPNFQVSCIESKRKENVGATSYGSKEILKESSFKIAKGTQRLSSLLSRMVELFQFP